MFVRLNPMKLRNEWKAQNERNPKCGDQSVNIKSWYGP